MQILLFFPTVLFFFWLFLISFFRRTDQGNDIDENITRIKQQKKELEEQQRNQDLSSPSLQEVIGKQNT